AVATAGRSLWQPRYLWPALASDRKTGSFASSSFDEFALDNSEFRACGPRVAARARLDDAACDCAIPTAGIDEPASQLARELRRDRRFLPVARTIPRDCRLRGELASSSQLAFLTRSAGASFAQPTPATHRVRLANRMYDGLIRL